MILISLRFIRIYFFNTQVTLLLILISITFKLFNIVIKITIKY